MANSRRLARQLAASIDWYVCRIVLPDAHGLAKSARQLVRHFAALDKHCRLFDSAAL